MKNRKHQRRYAGPSRRKHGKAVLPALVAVGGSLAGAPAAAIELGDIVVHSRIGQPLHASVVYALAPNETLESYCVSVQSGGFNSQLPGVGQPVVKVADGKITITSRAAVVEPMVSANVVVKCPYTPHVTRNYLMLIDPEGTIPVINETANVQAPTSAPAVVESTR